MATISFFGASYFIPWLGIVFAILLFLLFFFVNFSLSYYLNRVSEKTNRATVLSFKGMALNLGYGFIGIAYARLLLFLSEDKGITSGSDRLFKEGAAFFAPYFLIGSLTVAAFTIWKCRNINAVAKGLRNHLASDGA